MVAVPIFVREPSELDDALATAIVAAEHGADAIEWRIDALGHDIENDAEFVRELIQRTHLPSILTCRPVSEGGLFDLPEVERFDLFSQILYGAHHVQSFSEDDSPGEGVGWHGAGGPRFVDIELSSWQETPEWAILLSHFDDGPSLILSLHDFDSRPKRLLQQIEAMAAEPRANIIKVAWTARSLRDNLELFEIIKARPKPIIALGMSQFGLMSRVLAPKFGSFITFATLRAASAPGQPMLRDLKSLYRFDSIDEDTAVFGVVGWPIEHSLSPKIHNAGFEAVEKNAVYLPLPIPPEYEHFKATIGSMLDEETLHFSGASVTLPHKHNLLKFVRESEDGKVDRHATLAGAANTLLVGSGNKLVCRNTDVPAIIDAVCDALNINPEDLSTVPTAILGAGGVARAAVAGLVQYGCPITIFNRTPERAHSLVDEVIARGNDLGLIIDHLIVNEKDTAAALDGFQLIINCTSIGMTGGPLPDGNPLDELIGRDAWSLTEDMTVFDTVYTPSRTPLIAEAESRGARVILGIDMFMRQAALQFESWTGERAPEDRWREVLKRGRGE